MMMLEGGEEAVTFSALASGVRDENKMRLLGTPSSSGMGGGTGGGGSLQREWSRRSDGDWPYRGSGGDPSFGPDGHSSSKSMNLYNLYDADAYDEEAEEGALRMGTRGQKYTHSLFHSHRVRLGLVNCLLVTALIFGISYAVSSGNRESTKELGKEVDELVVELAKGKGGDDDEQTTQQAGLGAPAETSSTPDQHAVVASSATDDTDKKFEDDIGRYMPMLFDSEMGWMGKTYLDAFQFCKNVTSKDGRSGTYEICPYKAVCPLGPDSFPIVGYEGEDISWVPISDVSNDWANIGKKESCDRYSSINEFPPEWGIDGDGGDDDDASSTTSRVLCCLSEGYLLGYDTGLMTVGGAEGYYVGWNMAETFGHDNPNLPIYEEMAEDFQVLEFDRSRGWTGQTYLEAYDFCGSLDGYDLCPYGVVCPLVAPSAPIIGTKYEVNGSWAPITNNDWVQVGQDTPCTTYSSMFGEIPSWSVTGVGSEELTRHILCCYMPNASAAASTVSPTTAADDEYPVQNDNTADYGQLYVEAVEIFQPEEFDRNTGWNGSTYLEAVDFCVNYKDGFNVCPYEAICPYGHDTEPVSGHVKEIDGVDNQQQWMPIFDKVNDWVAINENEMCLRFSSMNPDVPEWGVTGEGSEGITHNLLCCLLKKDVSSALDEAYNDAIEEHDPTSYSREDGWFGQTYEDAVIFCSEMKGVKICPYRALCPLGPQEMPLWGYDKWGGVPGQTWAPISDTGDDFVQLSEGENACVRYSAIHDAAPDWGDSGEQFTRNIVCCEGSIIGDAEESFVYQTAATTYHPMRYNRLTGYMGQTYQDAVSFCSAKSSQTFLCPYEACECIMTTMIPIFSFRLCSLWPIS